jgi:hypothetical protein
MCYFLFGIVMSFTYESLYFEIYRTYLLKNDAKIEIIKYN